MGETRFRQINGRTVPISSKRGGGAVAVMLTGALLTGGALAGGGLAGGGLAGGAAGVDAGSTVGSAAARSVSARTANGRSSARKGQRDTAWQRMDLRRVRRVIDRQITCAVHSYGEVRQFFLRTPCRSLQRELFLVGDANGNTAVVTVAWVGMPKRSSARQLKKLVDTYGTGNVSPIASQALDLGGIRFTGQHYGSRRSGSLVVIAETEPVHGSLGKEVLKGIAQVAAEFPPP